MDYGWREYCLCRYAFDVRYVLVVGSKWKTDYVAQVSTANGSWKEVKIRLGEGKLCDVHDSDRVGADVDECAGVGHLEVATGNDFGAVGACGNHCVGNMGVDRCTCVVCGMVHHRSELWCDVVRRGAVQEVKQEESFRELMSKSWSDDVTGIKSELGGDVLCESMWHDGVEIPWRRSALKMCRGVVDHGYGSYQAEGAKEEPEWEKSGGEGTLAGGEMTCHDGRMAAIDMRIMSEVDVDVREMRGGGAVVERGTCADDQAPGRLHVGLESTLDVGRPDEAQNIGVVEGRLSKSKRGARAEHSWRAMKHETYRGFACRYSYKGCKKITMEKYNIMQHECSCKYRDECMIECVPVEKCYK